MRYSMTCWKCGAIAAGEPAYKCPQCGNILVFHYGFQPGDYRITPERAGIFRFSSVLPVLEEDADQVSMGEGNTPMIPSIRMRNAFGGSDVKFKLESMNPTASFKDRGLAVAMSSARRLGIRQMIIASSGNASASAAAYAARCGAELVAVVPETTPANKVTQAVTHGSRVVKVPGVFSDCYAFCRKMAEERGWFDMTTTFINPYIREGYKTIGYEIYEQLGRKAPDWIVLPTGAGPILAAVYQAFQELKELGETLKTPKLVCVQASACGPIAGAFLAGERKVHPCEEPKPTLASGINDSLNGYADDGDYTLMCIRASGGTAVLLSEEEIYASVLTLAGEGIYAEPAGAVSAAAIQKLSADGVIAPGETVVGVVTGHGLKNPLGIHAKEPPEICAADEMEGVPGR